MKELGQLVLLIVRGLLLWALVPLAALAWIVLGPLTGAALGACVGWVDLNLTALLHRIVAAPITGEPSPRLVPLARMATTEHRFSLLGPV